MRPDVLFVAAYAAVLLAVSAGLDRLGRVRTDPWASRALAGYRRRNDGGTVVDGVGPAWPHSEVPRLHTGIALVAAAAATLLTAVELVRRHHLAEVAVLGAALIFGVVALTRLVAQARGRA